MAFDFTARKGSTARSLYFTLTSSNAEDEFNTVTAVDFFMRKKGGNDNKIDGKPVAAFTLSDDEKSLACRYDWGDEDVDQVGEFEGYARTTTNSGQTDRFPSDGKENDFIKIKFEKNFE